MQAATGYWDKMRANVTNQRTCASYPQFPGSVDPSYPRATTSNGTQPPAHTTLGSNDYGSVSVLGPDTAYNDGSKTRDEQCGSKVALSCTCDTDSSQALSQRCHPYAEQMYNCSTETTEQSQTDIHCVVQDGAYVQNRSSSSCRIVEATRDNANDEQVCMTFDHTPGAEYLGNDSDNACRPSAHVQSPVREYGLTKFMTVLHSIAVNQRQYNHNHVVKRGLAQCHAGILAINLDEVLHYLNFIVTHLYGCLALNALVSVWSTECVATMVRGLSDDAIRHLIQDSRESRSVLEKMFSLHVHTVFERIVIVLSSSSFKMASASEEYLVIKAVVRNSLPEQKNRIIDSLVPFIPLLAVNKYGNHVAQEILLSLNCIDPKLALRVVGLSPALWMPLSCDAYASYFMQTYVSVINKAMRTDFIEAIVLEPVILTKMLEGRYSNFVLQKLIQTSQSADEFASLYNSINPVLSVSPFSCSISRKLQAQYFKLNLSDQN